MKRLFIDLLIAFALFSCVHPDAEKTKERIIELELKALEQWNNGDPSGFLELSASDVVYFDPMTEKRLEGHKALTELYESLRGEVSVDSIKMPNPKVQLGSEMAVLTFNLISYSNGKGYPWNCTEVYRKENDDEWKIIQTHWSLTKPELKKSEE